MEYKFTFEGREYKLNEENLDYFVNDEEKADIIVINTCRIY